MFDIITFNEFSRRGGSELLALPVWPIKCLVKKPVVGGVDLIMKATLRLISMGYRNPDKIAQNLGWLDSNVISVACDNLKSAGLINHRYELEELGKRTVQDVSTFEYYEKNYTYGYMFVNALDGSVCPYFHEGDLPRRISNRDNSLSKIIEISLSSANSIPRQPQQRQLYQALTAHARIQQYGRRNHTQKRIETYDVDPLVDDELKTKTKDSEIGSHVVLMNNAIQDPIALLVAISVEEESPYQLLATNPFGNEKVPYYPQRIQDFANLNIDVQVGDTNKSLADVIQGLRAEAIKKEGGDFEKHLTEELPKLRTSRFGAVSNIIYFLRKIYSACDQDTIRDADDIANWVGKCMEALLKSEIEHRGVKVDEARLLLGEAARNAAQLNQSICAEYGLQPFANNNEIADAVLKPRRGDIYQIFGSFLTLVIDAYANKNSALDNILRKKRDAFIRDLRFIKDWRNKIGAHNSEKELDSETTRKLISTTYSIINALVEGE